MIILTTEKCLNKDKLILSYLPTETVTAQGVAAQWMAKRSRGYSVATLADIQKTPLEVHLSIVDVSRMELW